MAVPAAEKRYAHWPVRLPESLRMVASDEQTAWYQDQVVLGDGRIVPVRATAYRPCWEQLPAPVRDAVEAAAGSAVVATWSAGTGFTPGFASRLSLADGRRVFVKAASSADDRLHGWPMSEAYREEQRKLSHLSADGVDIGAPPLLWHRSLEVEGDRWIILAFAHVEGRPPRRPWRPDELRLVLDRFIEVAPALSSPPAELALEEVADHLVGDLRPRLEHIRDRVGDSHWLDTVERLAGRAHDHLAGSSVVHMDLRDDNVLIGTDRRVWFVDWNWPVVGAAWIDLVCLLLSARGDGHDVDALLAGHPLTSDVDPAAVDCLLAVLLSFWMARSADEVPHGSPYLRDHQTWYAEVTRSWLQERLARRRPKHSAGDAQQAVPRG